MQKASILTWDGEENRFLRLFPTNHYRILLVFLIVSLVAQMAQAELSNSPREDTWMTNDAVVDMEIADDTLYLGGYFRYVGPNTGAGVPFDYETKKPQTRFSKLYGFLTAGASDGMGGWYVSGKVTDTYGEPYKNFLHIDSDGTLDPDWGLEINNSVRRIVVSGSTIYIAGYFTQVAGQARNCLAAIDVTTREVLEWNPNPDGYVINDIEIVGPTMYIAGQFSNVGGTPRRYVAAVDLETGEATGWNPTVDDSVNSLEANETAVYLVGWFGTVNGEERDSLAAVDSTTGALLDWNPQIEDGSGNIYISGIELSNSALYFCGRFSTVNGEDRKSIAAVDAISGGVESWNPNEGQENNYAIYDDIVINESNIFVFGYGPLQGLDSEYGHFLKLIDSNTTTVIRSDVYINFVAFAENSFFLGGDFNSVGGQPRQYLAALDTKTGELTDWNPNPESYVYDVEVSDSIVYIGGSFNKVGGIPRKYFAALDIETGLPTDLDPSPNNWVNAIQLDNETLYLGGDFRKIGGKDRNYLASIDVNSGEVTDWDPHPSGYIYQIELSDSMCYISGAFSKIGEESRRGLAAFDLETGDLANWNPMSDKLYSYLTVGKDNLFVCGNFTSIGGQPRHRLAALDPITGEATSWNPNLVVSNKYIYPIVVKEPSVYIGGELETINGTSRSSHAELDSQTGNITPWNPSFTEPYYDDYLVKSFAVTDSAVYVGGSFRRINGKPHLHFAQFDVIPDSLFSLTPDGEAWGAVNEDATLSEPTKWAPTGFHHDAEMNWQTVGGDFNGDQLQDLLCVTEYGEAWLSLNSGTETFYDSKLSASGYLYDEEQGWAVIPGDYNGDGVDDVAQVTEYGDIWLGINSGGTIPSPSLASNAGAMYDPQNGYWMGAGDVNGDFRDDIVSLHPNGSITVSLNKSNNKAESILVDNFPPMVEPATLDTGENEASLVFADPQFWGSFGFTYHPFHRIAVGDVQIGRGIALGDFNNDHRDDMVLVSSLGDAWVALSNGAGFDEPTRWGWVGFKFAPNEGDGWDIFTGDMNGDGVEDLVQLSEIGEAWVAYSSKSTFTEPVKLGATGFHSSPTGPWRSFVDRAK